MAIEHITNNDFQSKVLDSKGITIVDFYADWCGPCQMLSPVIEAVSAEHTEAAFYKINSDEQPELCVKYRIMSIPTLLVFKDGELVKTSIGLVSKAEIEDFLKL